MKIGIIGAGKVGCALAIALKEKGHVISGVYSKSEASANYLTDRLNLMLSNNIFDTVINSEAILITTSDSAINCVAELIANEVPDRLISNKVFLHCSGALNSDEIIILKEKGAFTGSLHPIQTFADKAMGWEALEGIYFGFEGCDESKVFAEKIINELNSKLLFINKASKVLYHAAACILSNYMVTLSFLAEGLFEKIGLKPEIGIEAFFPLMEKSLYNIKQSGSIKALTGPISRGDYITVEHHLKALEEISPEVLEPYMVLGGKTVDIGVKRGDLKNENLDKLNGLLKSKI